MDFRNRLTGLGFPVLTQDVAFPPDPVRRRRWGRPAREREDGLSQGRRKIASALVRARAFDQYWPSGPRGPATTEGCHADCSRRAISPPRGWVPPISAAGWHRSVAGRKPTAALRGAAGRAGPAAFGRRPRTARCGTG